MAAVAGPQAVLEDDEIEIVAGDGGIGGRDGNDVLEGAVIGGVEDEEIDSDSDDDGDGIVVSASGERNSIRRQFAAGANVYIRPELRLAGSSKDTGEDDTAVDDADATEVKKLRYKWYKSAFDIDIDELEVHHPWRQSYVDVSDYFNYGFNEASWYAYTVKQLKIRKDQGEGPSIEESQFSIQPIPESVATNYAELQPLAAPDAEALPDLNYQTMLGANGRGVSAPPAYVGDSLPNQGYGTMPPHGLPGQGHNEPHPTIAPQGYGGLPSSALPNQGYGGPPAPVLPPQFSGSNLPNSRSLLSSASNPPITASASGDNFGRDRDINKNPENFGRDRGNRDRPRDRDRDRDRPRDQDRDRDRDRPRDQDRDRDHRGRDRDGYKPRDRDYDRDRDRRKRGRDRDDYRDERSTNRRR
jgi:hypothetical protein